MKKNVLFLAFFLMSALLHLNAQTIANTAWKGFYGGELNDTITLHFKSDTFFVTGSGGDTLVRSNLKVSKDTIALNDIEGKYMCPAATGIYRFTIKVDNLNFILVNDPCEGRNAIVDINWARLDENKAKQ